MASVADPFDMLSSRQSFAVGETRVTAGRLLVPVLIIELSWRVVRAGTRSGLRRSHARAPAEPAATADGATGGA
jgi:hypothetical protein